MDGVGLTGVELAVGEPTGDGASTGDGGGVAISCPLKIIFFAREHGSEQKTMVAVDTINRSS
jgi:hypothetical protein